MSEEDRNRELNEAKQEIKLYENITKRLTEKAENLKKIQEELEKKLEIDSLSAKEAKQEQLMLDYIKSRIKDIQTVNTTGNEKTEILNLFKGFKQISFSEILDITKKKEEKIKSMLDELESEGKIVNLGEKKEPKCYECTSVLLDSRFSCPKCKNLEFENEDLIEHYDCNNVSRRSSYENDTCPQCKKPLKALGVDYKIDSNFYFCTKCNEKFSQPLLSMVCKICNTLQDSKNMKWSSSSHYKLV